jgi:uncharacterized protein
MSLSSQPSPLAADTRFSPAPLPEKNKFLFGPNGLRAGWRLLIFIVLVMGLSRATNFGLHHIPSFVAWEAHQSPNEMTATNLMVTEGLSVALLFIVVLIMSLIEGRSFADYYLPPSEAFGKRFWQGVPYGFAMLSLLLVMIAAVHGFTLTGFALGGVTAIKYGLLFFVGFILVGFLEEFSCRGYLQYTIGSGIGFWWAAIIISCLFGLSHIQNPAEDWFGAVMAGSFGLLAAFALYRTGNIWFPLGMHAAWDWGETYFYGTPDSGFVAQGHLLNSTMQGNKWLAGGIVGPEGSVFALVVLAIGAVGIHFLFPTKRVAA